VILETVCGAIIVGTLAGMIGYDFRHHLRDTYVLCGILIGSLLGLLIGLANYGVVPHGVGAETPCES
jgi:hypothetical protein